MASQNPTENTSLPCRDECCDKQVHSRLGRLHYVRELFPCNECAMIIIQSGIKTVVYYSDKKHDKEEVKAAKILFEEARVKTREYNGKKKQVMVDFQSIEDAALDRKKGSRKSLYSFADFFPSSAIQN